MRAIFILHSFDWFENEHREEPQILDLNDNEVAALKAMTPESLIDYLKNHCVGICNTVSGQDRYFIPRLTFGELSASLQVNYYVWRDRDEKGASHEDLISAEEFDAVCDCPVSVLDVAFYMDGRQISLGQMSVRQVCNFFNSLVDHKTEAAPTLDDRP